jgi:hypothetical protein
MFCAENFYDISNIDDLLLDNNSLEKFLNDQFCLKFCVKRTPEASIEGHRISFSNEVRKDDFSSESEYCFLINGCKFVNLQIYCKENDHLIVFIKSKAEELTAENFHSLISTTTVDGGPIASFLNCVQNIYIPAILNVHALVRL